MTERNSERYVKTLNGQIDGTALPRHALQPNAECGEGNLSPPLSKK